MTMGPGIVLPGWPLAVGVPKRASVIAPPWVPTSGGNVAALFADFTSEDGTKHYWANSAVLAGASAWVSALSGDFTRDDTAYFANASGLLDSVSANVMRFESECLLIEPDGTNSFVRSNELSTTSAWLKQYDTIVKNATGPDGVANSAWTMTGASTFNRINQSLSVSLTNGAYISCWFKQGTSPYALIAVNDSTTAKIKTTFFDLANGVVAQTNVNSSGSPTHTLSDAKIDAYADDWYRCSVKALGSGITTSFIYVGFTDADGVLNGAIAGHNGLLANAQFELGSARATSYIPTATATATRAADSLAITIPAGVTTLTFTFDDDSTQDKTVTPASSYTFPTDLNRPHIKQVVGYAA